MALADYSQASNLNPRDATLLYDKGVLLSSQGHYEEAISDYTAALSHDPAFGLALLGRANCWINLGESQKAILDLDAAVRHYPSFADAYLSRGVAWSMIDQLDKGLADLNEAIRLNTNWLPYAHYVRGGIQLKRGETDAAIDDYSKALQLDPKSSDCLLGRSSAYYKKRDLNRALADCYDAVRLAPQNALVYRNLGYTLIELKQFKEALASFEQGLAVDPTSTLLRESVAWMLATCPVPSLRDANRSLELARQLENRTDVADWEKLILLAAANAESGNLESAIAYQEVALETIPANRRSAEEETLATYRAGLPRRMK